MHMKGYVKSAIVACVHADTAHNITGVACGRKAYLRFHGFLCFDHFKAEQQSIPSPERKPWVRYHKDIPMNDSEIIADIVATDTAIIDAGRIERVRFGSLEPQYVTYLHSN